MIQIMKPCDICLTEECGGKKSCNCETCKHSKDCYKSLSPTIRITTKCTQKCSHCCFECSPDKNDFMSLETAKQISDFLYNNEIKQCSIMGGEFFCHPNWKEIFDLILPKVNYCRIVTNGDWASNTDTVEFLTKYKNKINVSISEDKWHQNNFTKEAKEQCEKYEINWNIPTAEMGSDEVIVPVGNSKWESATLYGMFATYCSNPKRQYSFLIDENGVIYKCGFGVWDYADVKDYIDGGFAERFKEFNKVFYNTFIPNCLRCSRVYLRDK